MEKILSDLKAMRLPGMAQTWQNLMEAHKIDSISMADGMRMLIQGENDMRMSNRTHRLIKNAHFRYTVALGEIAADSARGIDQSLLNEVATCHYIRHAIPSSLQVLQVQARAGWHRLLATMPAYVDTRSATTM